MTTYDDQNVFAKILRGELPAHKIYEDDKTVAIMDIMPRGDGDPRRSAADASVAWLDAERLSFPLRVRGIRPGDRFHPLGAPGRRKLQDFLVDEKVPREERGRVAVLESGGEIAWVMGMRIDERFKVREDTARIAELCILRE